VREEVLTNNTKIRQRSHYTLVGQQRPLLLLRPQTTLMQSTLCVTVEMRWPRILLVQSAPQDLLHVDRETGRSSRVDLCSSLTCCA
jgi:hypothetical protein